jgi:hypothetical protein
MPFANFKFPQGLLNEEQKEEIIHKTTDMFASYFLGGPRACHTAAVEASSPIRAVGATRQSQPLRAPLAGGKSCPAQLASGYKGTQIRLRRARTCKNSFLSFSPSPGHRH